MSTLHYADESSPQLAQVRVICGLLGLQLLSNKIASKFGPLIYQESTLLLNEVNAIALHLAQGTKLVGDFET